MFIIFKYLSKIFNRQENTTEYTEINFWCRDFFIGNAEVWHFRTP